MFKKSLLGHSFLLAFVLFQCNSVNAQGGPSSPTQGGISVAQKNQAFASMGVSDTCTYEDKGQTKEYVPYALCWNVVCDTAGPNATKASCTCPIYNGASWGTVSCEKRAAGYLAKDQIIFSEFSPRYLLNLDSNSAATPSSEVNLSQIKPVYICNNNKHLRNFRYADCWNMPCKPNKDGKTATCDCQIIYPPINPVFMTEANSCSEAQDNCMDYSGEDPHRVVNGADLNFGPKIVTKSLNYYLKGGDVAAQNYFNAAHCSLDLKQ